MNRHVTWILAATIAVIFAFADSTTPTTTTTTTTTTAPAVKDPEIQYDSNGNWWRKKDENGEWVTRNWRYVPTTMKLVTTTLRALPTRPPTSMPTTTKRAETTKAGLQERTVKDGTTTKATTLNEPEDKEKKRKFVYDSGASTLSGGAAVPLILLAICAILNFHHRRQL